VELAGEDAFCADCAKRLKTEHPRSALAIAAFWTSVAAWLCAVGAIFAIRRIGWPGVLGFTVAPTALGLGIAELVRIMFGHASPRGRVTAIVAVAFSGLLVLLLATIVIGAIPS
jgi:hypothetical protein